MPEDNFLEKYERLEELRQRDMELDYLITQKTQELIDAFEKFFPPLQLVENFILEPSTLQKWLDEKREVEK